MPAIFFFFLEFERYKLERKKTNREYVWIDDDGEGKMFESLKPRSKNEQYEQCFGVSVTWEIKEFQSE